MCCYLNTNKKTEKRIMHSDLLSTFNWLSEISSSLVNPLSAWKFVGEIL